MLSQNDRNALTLPGVLVTAGLVGSSDFRAQVGGRTVLTLEAHGDHWAPGEDLNPSVTALPRSSAGPTELLLTGIALPFVRTCPLGGWVLDVDGVPIHVGTSYPDPPPAAGQRVRFRGTVEVADGYVADEVQAALRRPTDRSWLVQRIVRLKPVTGGGQRTVRPEPITSIRHTADSSSYLIDLRDQR
ncbi:hypothetical protein [Actinoplanes siamensis]|uniref:Uncharacterized protein n=1 Tax=Actinoplanes siamensis TaxID=1223317 RepID=A0A919ND46_9ACTN|nr:hypothetical protein [Actinoplanes siamensis]GIF08555.1 hypothetical protein Asi03nite_60930 [Actinoplanes siamensis]